MSDQNHWACMACGHRENEQRACSRCGDDPLVDLNNPVGRETLIEDDASRRTRRSDRVRHGAVPFAIVFTILAAVYVPGVNLLLLILPFFMGYVVAMAFVALGLMALVKVAFPYKPRFPYLASAVL